jgi:sterol desaturase/sphingolipid hydroxylase (fatty acid hydroxylase superfamily)
MSGMALVAGLLRSLRALSPLDAALLFLAQNVVVFAAAMLLGAGLRRLFGARPVQLAAPPVERLEVGIAAMTVALNAAITWAGWWLWRAGVIGFRADTGARAWLDVALLVAGMDLAMYALHRLAHVQPLFGVLHALHHRYDRPRPLTLFVLHPLETISFGALWLFVCWALAPAWLAVVVYLTLNLAFGVAGHAGVEPLPRVAERLGIAGGRFHATHHADGTQNFGFYTAFWDRVLKTAAAAPLLSARERAVDL